VRNNGKKTNKADINEEESKTIKTERKNGGKGGEIENSLKLSTVLIKNDEESMEKRGKLMRKFQLK
jgi:hypothetical protein